MTTSDIRGALPFGDHGSWVVHEGGPDITEAEACVRAVTAVPAGVPLTAADPGARRVGVLWSSSSSGSDAYLRVLERLGHPRKRVVAAVGPLSGANADAAVVSTRFGWTGPSVSVFGPWTELHRWLIDYYLDSGRAEVMVAGFSSRHGDRVVAVATAVLGHSREERYGRAVFSDD
ncbi:hypothetical protein [Nocardia sp. NPDC020380]|uniref:hypothetical protein n=1 Tax=Nocardia sp. NPDC020380 TaxID=3364309 RepID=UPI0037ACF211